MKIYLSYKQTGVDKQELEQNLLFIKNKVEKLGHKIFIYYFEEDSNLSADKLNQKFLENIKKSDLVLAFLNYKQKSEGQLLELGMAYSLKKPIKILVNENVKSDYYLIYGLGDTIEFKNLENLDFKKLLQW